MYARPAWVKYGTAASVPFAVFIPQYFLWSTYPAAPFSLFYAAVFFSAWFGGRYAGLLTTLLSAVLANVFMLTPTLGGMWLTLVFFAISYGFSETIARMHAAKERERKAVQARDDFIAIASHDLRNPLNILMLHAQIGRRDSDPGVAAKFDALDKAVVRLSYMLDSLLDVTLLTSGKMSLNLTDLDAAALVREIVEQNKGVASARGSNLYCDAKDCVNGKWDRERLDQIVTNLISNAVKYGRGRPVEVAAFQNDGKLVITVKDYGIGIPDGDHSLIFERFKRARNANYNVEGLGIGLWVVRLLVEAMNGRIYVQSKQGDGSTFFVELPITT